MVTNETLEKTKEFVRINLYLKEFTELEKKTLLIDLLGVMCFNGNSDLYHFLENRDVAGFKAHVRYMNREGNKFKDELKKEK